MIAATLSRSMYSRISVPQQLKDTSKADLVVVLESRTKDRLDEDCGRAKSGGGAP